MDLPVFQTIDISGQLIPSVSTIKLILEELKEPEIIKNFCESSNALVVTLTCIYNPVYIPNEIKFVHKQLYRIKAEVSGLDFDDIWWAMATQNWFDSMFLQTSMNPQDLRKELSSGSSRKKNNPVSWEKDLFRYPEYRRAIDIIFEWRKSYEKKANDNYELKLLDLYEKRLHKTSLTFLAEINKEFKANGESKSFICQFCKKDTIVDWESRQRKSCDDCTRKYSVLTTERNRQKSSATKIINPAPFEKIDNTYRLCQGGCGGEHRRKVNKNNRCKSCHRKGL